MQRGDDTEAVVLGSATETVLDPPRSPRDDRRSFKPELTPSWLHLITLLAGQRPIDPTAAMNLLYLGGGRGLTPAVVAACHPRATVRWWDPDVGGTEAARLLVDAARLDNLEVHERPDPPDDPGSPVDLVVVDALLDSTSQDEQTALLGAAATMLRPGGTLCVTYRTEVGWSEITPVHRLIRRLLASHPAPPLHAVNSVRRTMTDLVTGDAHYISRRPIVAAWLADLLERDDRELVDSVSRPLHPRSHRWVVEALRPLGCVFVAGARAEDVAPSTASPDLADLVQRPTDPVLRESLDDIAVRRSHRADIFRLGAAPLDPDDHHRRLRTVALASWRTAVQSSGPDESAGTTPVGPGGARIGDLIDDHPDGEMPVRALLAGGLVHPMMGPVEPTAALASARLTRTVSDPTTRPHDRFVVAPALGTALPGHVKPDAEHAAAWGIR